MRWFPVLVLGVSMVHPPSPAPAVEPAQRSGAELQRAIERLSVVGSVLYVAAHPDDENTRLLAWLVGERGLRTAYVSMTRGGGGQNLVGTEQAEMLGVLRTLELLAARRIDGAEQRFTRARDFGYSKTPEETTRIWGHERILGDLVRVIRRFRPDVVITRFDTEGPNHGHHTASARLAVEAFAAAADPSRFPEQLALLPSEGRTEVRVPTGDDPHVKSPPPSSFPLEGEEVHVGDSRAPIHVWQADRLMENQSTWRLPEDADLSAYLQLDVGAYDPLLGRSFGEIAAASRSMHKSQGFGRAPERGPVTEYFEPLAGARPQDHPLEGLDFTWNRFPGTERLRSLLRRAAGEFAPPRPERSIPILLEARQALRALPADNPWRDIKRRELDGILLDCAGLWLAARADSPVATPGQEVVFTLHALNRRPADVRLSAVRLPDGSRIEIDRPLPESAPFDRTVHMRIAKDRPLTIPHWLREEPRTGSYRVADPERIGLADDPPALAVVFELSLAGQQIVVERPLTHAWTDPVHGERIRSVEVLPPVSVSFDADALVLPNGEAQSIRMLLEADRGPFRGTLELNSPGGWRVEPESVAIEFGEDGGIHEIVASVGLGGGRVSPRAAGSGRGTAGSGSTGAAPTPHDELRLTAVIAGAGRRDSWQRRLIDHPHVPRRTILRPAEIRLTPVDIAMTDTRIGYVPGPGDEVAEGLRQIGFDVVILAPQELAEADLDRFDTIVTGVRAWNTEPLLRRAHARLVSWVERGGRLVVQYNKNSRWNPLEGPVGPFPLTIGRDRITDENAEVQPLVPEHPLLRRPNRIEAGDFAGWVQERGLYFAESWDDRYQPVLEMADPGEEPLRGALLYARHGKGSYVYTGLSFFRQLPAGVPGAYRLMANLVSHEP